jgi:hypothetical protein
LADRHAKPVRLRGTHPPMSRYLSILEPRRQATHAMIQCIGFLTMMRHET